MADFGTVASRGLWTAALKPTLAGPVPASLAAAPAPAHTAPGQQAPGQTEELDDPCPLVAFSPAMREVQRQVEQVAAIDAPVLLLGESGSGKEVVARLIHKLSARSAHRFMKVNCAGFAAGGLDSELFGRQAGAFSGARQARAGKLELCRKGVILLDEIAEMPASSQVKLLHVLEDGEFSRLGGAAAIQSDVRVLAASNADVRLAVENGILRADLYYRLNVFTIHLPPLRERHEDLPCLLNHFMTACAAGYGRPRLAVTRRILDACAGYSWPGNVRELENFVKRYLVLGDEKLALSQLDLQPSRGPEPAPKSEDLLRIHSAGKPPTCDLKSLVHDLKHGAERAAIVEALEQSGGNRQDAANLLRISLRALHYKIRAYGIHAATSRSRNGRALRETPGPRPMAAAGAGEPSGPDRSSFASWGAGATVYPFPRNGGGKLIPMSRAPWPPSR